MKDRLFRLLVVSGALVACLSGCLSIKPQSAVPEVQESYLKNTAAAPVAYWSQVLPSPEADIIQCLDGQHVLLGTMRLVLPNKFLNNFYFDRLACIDITSGNTIWSVPRDGFGTATQALISFQPSIVIIGSDGASQLVSIIDPGSGKVLATRRPEGPVFPIERGQALAVMKIHQDTLSIEGISLANGRTRWEREFPKMVGPTAETVTCDMGSTFIVGGQSTVMLRCADGSTVWSNAEPFAGAKLLAAGDYLLAGDSRGVRAIRLSNGEIAWKGPASSLHFIASDGTRAYVASKATQGVEIRAYDLSSGSPLWIAPIDDLHSPMVFDASSIYVTTHSDLVALRMSDGTRRMTAHIDPGIYASAALSDILSIRGSRLYLGREQGIVAWDLSTGSQLYSVAVGGSAGETVDYQDFKWASFAAALAGKADYHPVSNTQFTASRLNGVDALAQSYQRYVQQSAAASVQSGTSSSTAGAVSNVAAVSGMAAAEATLNVSVSAIQLGQSIGHTIALASWSGEGAESQASQLRMTRTVDTGYRTIYGQMLGERYYVRPNFRDGLRLTLVRLEDGLRADIRLFPGEVSFHGWNCWHVPAFALSPDEKAIVVSGMDPDATRYATHEVMGGDATGLISWAVPYPFVMNLSMERMRFAPAANPPAALPTVDPSARALIASVLAGDKEKVKSLLKQGVSPDVCDELGHPVYSFATQFFNADIMRLLNDFGVDGLKTDPEGIHACDYLSYPIRPPGETQYHAIMAVSDALGKWKEKHKN